MRATAIALTTLMSLSACGGAHCYPWTPYYRPERRVIASATDASLVGGHVTVHPDGRLIIAFERDGHPVRVVYAWKDCADGVKPFTDTGASMDSDPGDTDTAATGVQPTHGWRRTDERNHDADATPDTCGIHP